ncbi:DUF4230 domain-containing protein [Spongiimicrobium salis]|uniref:DUF4230 domain-containing protein n=1 Tax=Spongiimicrobium salis TaxID=1667022 RepID=UPI00374D6360
MKKVGVGILLAVTAMLIYRSCTDYQQRKTILQENSMLLQEQLQQVAKLVVTEGHFSEVYTYKDSQALFGDWIRADKKALVVVNAEAQVSFDLKKTDIVIEEASKTVYLKRIPEAEIKIYPDFKYYDVTADYFNPFKAEDYNAIKENVTASLRQKVEASSLLKNAQDRFIAELSKYYILTSSMDWKLVYKDRTITDLEKFLEEEGNTLRP